MGALVDVVQTKHLFQYLTNHGVFSLFCLDAVRGSGNKRAMAVARCDSGVISGQWPGIIHVANGLDVQHHVVGGGDVFVWSRARGKTPSPQMFPKHIG